MYLLLPNGWHLLLALFLSFLSVVAHELGHALAFHGHNITIKEIGFGAPPFGVFSRVPTWRLSLWGAFANITLAINPIPIGAWVDTSDKDDKQFKQLPYTDQATILGAGIVANIVFSAVVLVLALLFSPLCQ